jgi:hypothetical protein
VSAERAEKLKERRVEMAMRHLEKEQLLKMHME